MMLSIILGICSFNVLVLISVLEKIKNSIDICNKIQADLYKYSISLIDLFAHNKKHDLKLDEIEELVKSIKLEPLVKVKTTSKKKK